MVTAARVYMDHAATTPLDPLVRAAMRPFLDAAFGNPSSLHGEGRAARTAVDDARRHVADLVGAQPGEVFFTSGGTEADNLALRGVLGDLGGQPAHIIVSAFEHPAVLETAFTLQRHGVAVSLLSVSADGIVDPAELESTIRPDTRLVSVMAANNVVGTLQPIRELARIAHEHGVLFHTDAVQAAGKIPLDLRRDGLDLLSLSAHKLHGPKGCGALVVRSGVPLAPIIFGGGQERGLRSGTENVAAIVGFGEAARTAAEERMPEAVRLVRLRDRIIAGVCERVRNAYVIGDRHRRLPGHICLGFAGQEGEAIRVLLALDDAGFAVSTGSACSAHKAAEPSYVLRAMGFDVLRARGALRITLGRFNTADEVERFLNVLPRVVSELNPITRRRDAATGAN